ncbi:hypothetical protein DSO57_1006445 [Entomophthora muscae]|uniref:Uncharacterized protein n=1 Tax=Entomophthora muscae TaxID=34485 RepID=A0ACC2UT01_9FUNG|nr:hypothetical protein DSO57_1006445 [Entomophthora muscae]
MDEIGQHIQNLDPDQIILTISINLTLPCTWTDSIPYPIDYISFQKTLTYWLTQIPT